MGPPPCHDCWDPVRNDLSILTTALGSTTGELDRTRSFTHRRDKSVEHNAGHHARKAVPVADSVEVPKPLGTLRAPLIKCSSSPPSYPSTECSASIRLKAVSWLVERIILRYTQAALHLGANWCLP